MVFGACGTVWKVIVRRHSNQLVHLEVQWKNDRPWFLTVIYGSPQVFVDKVCGMICVILSVLCLELGRLLVILTVLCLLKIEEVLSNRKCIGM